MYFVPISFYNFKKFESILKLISPSKSREFYKLPGKDYQSIFIIFMRFMKLLTILMLIIPNLTHGNIPDVSKPP